MLDSLSLSLRFPSLFLFRPLIRPPLLPSLAAYLSPSTLWSFVLLRLSPVSPPSLPISGPAPPLSFPFFLIAFLFFFFSPQLIYSLLGGWSTLSLSARYLFSFLRPSISCAPLRASSNQTNHVRVDPGGRRQWWCATDATRGLCFSPGFRRRRPPLLHHHLQQPPPLPSDFLSTLRRFLLWLPNQPRRFLECSRQSASRFPFSGMEGRYASSRV